MRINSFSEEIPLCLSIATDLSVNKLKPEIEIGFSKKLSESLISTVVKVVRNLIFSHGVSLKA